MWTCPKCGEVLEDQFATCWRCAAEKSQGTLVPPRVKASDYFKAAAIAYLIPWLAICIQSSTRQYGWWYTAILAHIYFKTILWTALPAAINFLLLLPTLKRPTESRIVAIVLLIGWTWLLLSLTPKLK